MRPRPFLLALVMGGALAFAAAPAVAADEATCAAQFVRTGARDVVPFGRLIVAPEARNPTLGGANLGQEVVSLFARADRSACPITPP